jgi:hypothetical protein
MTSPFADDMILEGIVYRHDIVHHTSGDDLHYYPSPLVLQETTTLKEVEKRERERERERETERTRTRRIENTIKRGEKRVADSCISLDAPCFAEQPLRQNVRVSSGSACGLCVSVETEDCVRDLR